MEELDPEALTQMKQSPHNYPGTAWAAYQNKAFDSARLGHIQFLAIGPENTFKEQPDRFPDAPPHGVGWKYLFIGWVNLETGEIDRRGHG